MIIAVITVYDTITIFTISIDVTSFDLDKPCLYNICKSGAYGGLETDAPLWLQDPEKGVKFKFKSYPDKR